MYFYWLKRCKLRSCIRYPSGILVLQGLEGVMGKGDWVPAGLEHSGLLNSFISAKHLRYQRLVPSCHPSSA